VEPDNDANYRLYGKMLTATDIVRGTDVKPSTDGQPWLQCLTANSQSIANENRRGMARPRPSKCARSRIAILPTMEGRKSGYSVADSCPFGKCKTLESGPEESTGWAASVEGVFGKSRCAPNTPQGVPKKSSGGPAKAKVSQDTP
jgi:hypothetical protein